jgi:hypothetical protein
MEKEKILGERLQSNIAEEDAKRHLPLRKYAIEVKDKIITDNCLWVHSIPLHFIDCIFIDKISFFRLEMENDISFTRCSFSKDLYFDVKRIIRVVFNECEIKEALRIIGNIDRVSIYNTTINKISVSATTIKRIEIGGQVESYIRSIYIGNDVSIDKLEIANSKVEQIGFYGLGSNTEVFNCHINSICFHKVRNDGVLKILNCKALELKDKTSHFISNESHLGKAEFFQFDFSTFDEVNIINSVLIDCLFINTDWSDNIKSFAGDQMDEYLKDRTPYNTLLSLPASKNTLRYKETKKQLKDKREVYKQIKYALSKQGDIVNERRFHAMEMNTYRTVLSNAPKNISTKVILYLSYVSSDYGQSLLRPILFLLLVNGIFISLLNFHNGLVITLTLPAIVNTISNFIWYLNPFHKDDSLRGVSFIIDTLIRIVSSYSIYNIIRATRRFIK